MEKERMIELVQNLWTTAQRSGIKKPYWKVLHASNKVEKGKTLMENFEDSELESSFDQLITTLDSSLPACGKYLHIWIYSAKSDPNPLKWGPFENPESQERAIGINGLPQTGMGTTLVNQGYSKADVDKMVEERLVSEKKNQALEIEKLKLEMQFQKQFEDMQAQIEGLAETQKTTFDKILGLAEHPVIANLLQVGIAKLFSGGQAQPTGQTVPQQGQPIYRQTAPQQGPVVSGDNSGDYEEEEYYDDEEDIEETAEKIQKGMEGLEKVFPGESAELIEELGEIAKLNPDLVKQIRASMKQMIGK